MNIFIDTKTGTWGDPEGLVLAEISTFQLNALDNMSDSEIINFGLEYGDKTLDLAAPKADDTPVKVQILHGRDPDSDCGITVFVNGQRVPDAEVYVEDVDPGRGYEDGVWEERIEESRSDTTEFGQLVTATLEQFGGAAEKYGL